MSVTRLAIREKPPQDGGHEAWLKRQAVQLVAQLPEKPQDALAIIAYMELLVKTFLASTPV